jgi:aminoglycoside phosphotransferase (APT) family kinase protein
MHSDPDGVEVVATIVEARERAVPPLLVVDTLRSFLDNRGIGSGDLSWGRIGDGQSNVTFKIARGGRVFVLRRGPRPPLPRSTHDMVREARIQELVGAAGVPVPRILAVCDDESVLGVPFYLMEFLDGVVITNRIPDALSSPQHRRATSLAAVDELVRLHRVDVTTGGLASFGRPDGYLRRQVDRFSTLWQPGGRELPRVQEVGAWLSSRIPQSQGAAVVHGDFRLGNLMFDPAAPATVTAILDWEMATIGDPLADLGYLTATYAELDGYSTPLELTTVTREPGYASRTELIDRYQQQAPLNLEALPWYQALALWKAAIFCEAIYRRWLSGERPDDSEFGPSLEAGVPRLLAAASRLIEDYELTLG